MAIIINWVEQQKQSESCIEIPMFKGSFVIHFIDNVITKTEWRLQPLDTRLVINNQWQEIQGYLNNPEKSLTVNLKLQGSDYRHKVWAEMCKIPVGKTLSYSALASKIDSGARAVANACRDNPFPGIIPCHRVVAVSGLGGYMGQTSGECLDLKRMLLALEQKLLAMNGF